MFDNCIDFHNLQHLKWRARFFDDIQEKLQQAEWRKAQHKNNNIPLSTFPFMDPIHMCHNHIQGIKAGITTQKCLVHEIHS